MLSSAPEYVDRYFEFKSMDCYSKDEGSMAVGRYAVVRTVDARTEIVFSITAALTLLDDELSWFVNSYCGKPSLT